MTDEKQIKKMAQDIACNCVDLVETSCDGKPCYVCIAEKLAKQNYRKIPENAVVVMPDKITEETSPEDIIKIAKYNEKVRKETAREILTEVSKVCGDYQWFKNLREEYGVEVEE